jgi:hypothetical protein
MKKKNYEFIYMYVWWNKKVWTINLNKFKKLNDFEKKKGKNVWMNGSWVYIDWIIINLFKLCF